MKISSVGAEAEALSCGEKSCPPDISDTSVRNLKEMPIDERLQPNVVGPRDSDHSDKYQYVPRELIWTEAQLHTFKASLPRHRKRKTQWESTNPPQWIQ